MRQHGDERWSGHREITRAAVRRLFADTAGPDGRIRGLDERQYADRLDHAQARQDRALGAGLVRHFGCTSLTVPYAGFGPTMHSAYANPDAQREHFMADPYRAERDRRLALEHRALVGYGARRDGAADRRHTQRGPERG